MRQALLFTAGVVATVVPTAFGCSHGDEAQMTTINAATLTGEPELSRSVSAISERMALEIGAHEARCGRPEQANDAACVDATLSKARSELLGWGCDPASTRARAEECLVSIRTELCDVDYKSRPNICPGNATCGPRTADLAPPGPQLAEIWR